MRMEQDDHRLIDFALGELDAEEARQVEAALALEENAEARQAVEEYRQVAAMAAAALQVSQADGSLTGEQREHVLQQAGEGPGPDCVTVSPHPRRRIFLAGLPLAAALLLGLGLLLYGALNFRPPAGGVDMAQAPAEEIVEQLQAMGYLDGDETAVPVPQGTPAPEPKSEEVAKAPEDLSWMDELQVGGKSQMQELGNADDAAPEEAADAGAAQVDESMLAAALALEELPAGNPSQMQVIGVAAAPEAETAPAKVVPAVAPAGEGPMAPIEIELPEPSFAGTPCSYWSPQLEEEEYRDRPPFFAPAGTALISRGKPVTSSTAALNLGRLAQITDGDKDFEKGSLVELPEGLQWVQVDLEANYEVHAVLVWHFHKEKRVYFDFVVQVSDSPDFSGDVTTLYSTDYDNSTGLGIGKDKEYIESAQGRLIAVPGGVEARYVRLYSGGNSANAFNHYVEVEVFGKPLKQPMVAQAEQAPEEEKIVVAKLETPGQQQAQEGLHNAVIEASEQDMERSREKVKENRAETRQMIEQLKMLPEGSQAKELRFQVAEAQTEVNVVESAVEVPAQPALSVAADSSHLQNVEVAGSLRIRGESGEVQAPKTGYVYRGSNGRYGGGGMSGGYAGGMGGYGGGMAGGAMGGGMSGGYGGVPVEARTRAGVAQDGADMWAELSPGNQSQVQVLGGLADGDGLGGHRVYDAPAAPESVDYFYGVRKAPPAEPRSLGGVEVNAWFYSGGEAYAPVPENPFVAVRAEPLSTFSIDVDTGSYANVRRFLTQGELPPPAAVRIEELVNYFKYNYPEPSGESPFTVHVELGESPWQEGHLLAKIGLKGKDIPRPERVPGNVVFLIDVSGSMRDANKLPLLKESMKALVRELNAGDRVGIVTYSTGSRVVLDSTPCEEKEAILAAIEGLSAGGSTNGEAGLAMAYDLAARHLRAEGINRVILATDGDFNVGHVDEHILLDLVRGKAKERIFLTVLGFGTGNLKDSRLEFLADKGNGQYAYIDSFAEARKVLVAQLAGSLVTIAKDVKIQVEFNPGQVREYRLIGYENRQLQAEDFNNDQVDAGEIGAGHTVTALYEIVPVNAPARQGVDPLKYQPQPEPAPADKPYGSELMTVKLRYKAPEGTESIKMEVPVAAQPVSEPSADFRQASAVAAFGMLLRHSQYAGPRPHGTT